MSIWHFLVHVTGTDAGSPYGHWSWAAFWQGIAGSFVFTVAAALLIWWRGYSCHRAWWCFRHGRHPLADGKYRVCWKHHPDMARKPTWEDKIAAHHAAKKVKA